MTKKAADVEVAATFHGPHSETHGKWTYHERADRKAAAHDQDRRRTAVRDDQSDRRLNKELGLYKQEADEQAARVKEYVDQGRDEWDIRKQVRHDDMSHVAGGNFARL